MIKNQCCIVNCATNTMLSGGDLQWWCGDGDKNSRLSPQHHETSRHNPTPSQSVSISVSLPCQIYPSVSSVSVQSQHDSAPSQPRNLFASLYTETLSKFSMSQFSIKGRPILRIDALIFSKQLSHFLLHFDLFFHYSPGGICIIPFHFRLWQSLHLLYPFLLYPSTFIHRQHALLLCLCRSHCHCLWPWSHHCDSGC